MTSACRFLEFRCKGTGLEISHCTDSVQNAFRCIFSYYRKLFAFQAQDNQQPFEGML